MKRAVARDPPRRPSSFPLRREAHSAGSGMRRSTAPTHGGTAPETWARGSTGNASTGGRPVRPTCGFSGWSDTSDAYGIMGCKKKDHRVSSDDPAEGLCLPNGFRCSKSRIARESTMNSMCNASRRVSIRRNRVLRRWKRRVGRRMAPCTDAGGHRCERRPRSIVRRRTPPALTGPSRGRRGRCRLPPPSRRPGPSRPLHRLPRRREPPSPWRRLPTGR